MSRQRDSSGRNGRPAVFLSLGTELLVLDRTDYKACQLTALLPPVAQKGGTSGDPGLHDTDVRI